MNKVSKDASGLGIVERTRSEGGTIGGENVRLVQISREGTKSAVVMVRRRHDQVQLIETLDLSLIHHLIVRFHIVVVVIFIVNIHNLRLILLKELPRRIQLRWYLARQLLILEYSFRGVYRLRTDNISNKFSTVHPVNKAWYT